MLDNSFVDNKRPKVEVKRGRVSEPPPPPLVVVAVVARVYVSQ